MYECIYVCNDLGRYMYIYTIYNIANIYMTTGAGDRTAAHRGESLLQLRPPRWPAGQ